MSLFSYCLSRKFFATSRGKVETCEKNLFAVAYKNQVRNVLE